MVGMIAREGADAERAEKLLLVKHLGQHAAELRLVQNGSKPATRDTDLSRVMDQRA